MTLLTQNKLDLYGNFDSLIFVLFVAMKLMQQNTKVGFTTGGEGAAPATVHAVVHAVSRPGKQPVEDPSVGVIKNILK